MRMHTAPMPLATAPSREPTLNELRIALQRAYQYGTAGKHVNEHETYGDMLSRQIREREIAYGLIPPPPPLPHALPNETAIQRVMGWVVCAILGALAIALVLHGNDALIPPIR